MKLRKASRIPEGNEGPVYRKREKQGKRNQPLTAAGSKECGGKTRPPLSRDRQVRTPPGAERAAGKPVVFDSTRENPHGQAAKSAGRDRNYRGPGLDFIYNSIASRQHVKKITFRVAGSIGILLNI